MEQIVESLNQLRATLDFPIVKFGLVSLKLWSLVYIIVLLFILFFFSRRLQHWVTDVVLQRAGIEFGVRHATGALVRYVALAIGTVIIVQTAGIDLSVLTILAGGLGVGLGFGLQTIASNMVSGFIMLFEQPIKVGDVVKVGELTGTVKQVSLRATTIVTNDNISIIVPNSEFITSTVTNWTHTTPEVRFNFPVRVSYDAEPQFVRSVLLEVAQEHVGVLTTRKPDVLLNNFGENAVEFTLRVWTRDYVGQPGVLRSELNYAICKKFKENSIEIPYPHYDVRIRGMLPSADTHLT